MVAWISFDHFDLSQNIISWSHAFQSWINIYCLWSVLGRHMDCRVKWYTKCINTAWNSCSSRLGMMYISSYGTMPAAMSWMLRNRNCEQHNIISSCAVYWWVLSLFSVASIFFSLLSPVFSAVDFLPAYKRRNLYNKERKQNVSTIAPVSVRSKNSWRKGGITIAIVNLACT